MNKPDHSGMCAADEATLRAGVEYAYAAAVPGDVIEFGCYLGRTAAMLADAMRFSDAEYGPAQESHDIAERSLWVFDSFEGFPVTSDPVDAASPHIRSSVWKPGIPRGASPQDILDVCGRSLEQRRIVVGQGWFKDSLALIPPETRFAFVHVDCDYYESAFQVLDHLFTHRMFSDGCALYFDDWYCNRGSPKFGEQKAWADAIAKHKFETFTDWGAYGIVGRRFIVHTHE